MDSKDITAMWVVLDVGGVSLNPSLILVCSGTNPKRRPKSLLSLTGTLVKKPNTKQGSGRMRVPEQTLCLPSVKTVDVQQAVQVGLL